MEKSVRSKIKGLTMRRRVNGIYTVGRNIM
jgi:hypothetical protein